MTKWNIRITDVVDYQIEAKTKDEAIELALDWWAERMPKVETKTDSEMAQEI